MSYAPFSTAAEACSRPKCGALAQAAIFCATFCGVLDVSAALAQAPLPPRRPAHLDNRDATKTIPQPAPPNAPATSPLDPAQIAPRPQTGASTAKPPSDKQPADMPWHPMTEPGSLQLRRAAIRSCTEEWQKMKRAGATGLRTWRDFSMECLTRKN